MNYPQKSSNFENRKKASRHKILLIIVVLIIALIILATTVAKKTLFFIAEPIWKIENYIAASSANGVEYFKSKQTLMAEKQAMQAKIFEAGTLSSMNTILQTENDTLKDLLGRKNTKQRTILSAILVKPPQNLYDVLTIDIGTDHGVKVGDKVMADANVYIGEVSEVFPNSSKVILYSSPGEKRQVVLGTNSVSAEAVDRGGGNFSIFLPREIEVKENDVIVIPSITPNVFGIVEKVSSQDKDSFQTVLFKSPVNISELSFVEVVL
jgi:cell shape-determining protein MreC